MFKVHINVETHQKDWSSKQVILLPKQKRWIVISIQQRDKGNYKKSKSVNQVVYFVILIKKNTK